MERFRLILYNVYGNLECTSNYRAWADHIEYKIECYDGSNSKLAANNISENMLYKVDS